MTLRLSTAGSASVPATPGGAPSGAMTPGAGHSGHALATPGQLDTPAARASAVPLQTTTSPRITSEGSVSAAAAAVVENPSALQLATNGKLAFAAGPGIAATGSSASVGGATPRAGPKATTPVRVYP
jgi:hypothetical protein